MTRGITLHAPFLHDRGTLTRLISNLEFDGKTVEMWYEVPTEYSQWFSTDRSDGFVVGFILQAMELGQDITTVAPMSSRLWHSLTQFFIPMMAKAYSHLNSIQIFPSSLIEATSLAKGVAGGFSGGIDSFAAIVDHFVNEDYPNYRISHFLCHNVGSHGDKNYLQARTLFQQRYAALKKFPEIVGVKYIAVDTNIHEIIPVDFVKTYITLNASVPLVLQNHFRRYFYASSYKYEDCGVTNGDVIGRFDPMAFHMLSTETLDCVSTGGQMSRVEKTKHVSSYEMSRRFLNVCTDPAFEGSNCSVCIKCCRTLLTLDLLGISHLYADVFDLSRFNNVRKRYIKNNVIPAPKGGFEYEIMQLAMEICKEPWANYLRRRHSRRAAILSIKTFIQKVRRTLWGITVRRLARK